MYVAVVNYRHKFVSSTAVQNYYLRKKTTPEAIRYVEGEFNRLFPL
jgi:hypothetical protein